MSSRQVAVITGDINASSGMPTNHAAKLETVLWTSFKELKKALPEAKAEHFTCFRGDSWQFVVNNQSAAISAGLFYRASLLVQSDQEFGKSYHASFAVGFGEAEYLPDQDSSAGGGEAYVRSGHRLDKLKRRVPGMGVLGLGEKDKGVDAATGLIDALVRKWTALQARAVCLAMQGYSQEQIAERWSPKPVSQQAVQKHLSAAGWPAIEPALEWITTTINGCFCKNNHRELYNAD